MKSLASLKKSLKQAGNPKKAAILRRFFKTGPGEYGAGDVFLGIQVPEQRRIARLYSDLSPKDLSALLASPIHEFRLVALFILISQYEKAPSLREKKKLFDFYRANLAAVNNWDLVDLSAPKIMGDYLLKSGQGEVPLLKMAASSNLWERRIAMVSTFAFIRAGREKEAFKVAQKLIQDDEDLIHKALGWMLREVGKQVGEDKLISFLDRQAGRLPRTALRYSLERLSPAQRRYYLGLKRV